MVSASLGGLGPGVLTMVCGFLAARYFWIPPVHQFQIITPDLAVYTLIYLLVTSGIIVFSLLLRASLLERIENEQRFGSLFKYNLDAVFVFDAMCRIIAVNPQGIRLTGFTEDELLGHSFDFLCRPDQVPHVQDCLQRAMEGRPKDFEFSILRKDGTAADLQFSAGPIIVEDEASGIYGVAKDLTSRKTSEAVLRDVVKSVKCILSFSDVFAREGYENDSLATNYQSIRARMTVLDEEAAQQVLPLELKKGESYVKAWLRSRHPDDLVQMRERACRAIINNDSSYAQEFRAVDKFGKEHWFSQLVSVEPKGPRRWLRVAVTTDITERKRAEGDLLRAKEEAENANIAKDRFIAVMSHELRTPLNPVLMAIHAWKGAEGLPPQLIQDFDMMRHNIDIEVRLISDLLDLTAISKGKLSLEFQPVDVHELLMYALNIAQSQSLEKKLRISEQLHAECNYVLSDPTRLQQVFWNLISNAVKFTPSGGSIEVTTRNEPGLNGSNGHAASERLVVEIRDSGLGMDSELVQKIFDPFEQGNVEITSQFGGLGLGLSIAKGFVELLGGSIHAESQGPGKGSVFSVTLEALKDPLAAGM